MSRRIAAKRSPAIAGSRATLSAVDDSDLDYTWGNFVDVRAFYDRAAAADRAVIFTAT
jgi:hypothetical protein